MIASDHTVLCNACTAENPEGKRFCGDCGAALEGHELELVDEIRTATVLFADVAHFTKLSAEMGLEAIKLLMDEVFDRLYQQVLHHGGVVDKYIGDCVMALFGAPIAYGDDAARAVRAGLAFQRTLAAMRPDLVELGLPPIEMRVGINSGPVIAGAVGAGPQRRYTVMGHTVNVASHLQQDAPIGAVVIGEGTLRRVRGLFDSRELVGSEHRGYIVDKERFGGLWLRPREILGAEVEMVGREEELAQLTQLVRQTRETRRAQLVVVSGDAGIGKTRLGAELISWLEQQHGDVVSGLGVADPRRHAEPFGVAADLLRRKVGRNNSLEEQIGALMTLARNAGCAVVDGDRAVFARLLGAGRRPSDDNNDGSATGDKRSQSGERRKRGTGAWPSHGHFTQRCLELLSEMMVRFAELTPLVLVVEEMHWCDEASMALIERVMQRAYDKPLLIVGLARPRLLREHPTLVEGPARHVIALERLPAEAVGELLERMLGARLRQRLESLCASALGNPFHIEELLRTLEERGVLVRQVNGWELGDVPADFGIPPGVEAVTQVRIDNLSPSQRQVLRWAAAIGPTFWDGALRGLARATRGFDDGAVEGRDAVGEISAGDLSTLVRRELIVPQQDSRVGGQREFRFLHEMTHEVAYAMIPQSRRAPLHLCVAEWLVEHLPGARTADDLAAIGAHFDRGGDAARASSYLSRAADAAHDRGAYAGALRHLDRAVELASDEDSLVFDLLARRERVYNALGRWSEQLEDAQRLISLAPVRDRRRVEALLRLGRARLNRGEHQLAREGFEEALSVAESLSDVEGRARALRWLGMVHFNRSEHRQALPRFSEALALAERAELGGLAAELAYEYGVTAGTIGDYGRAVDVSRRALEMFRQQGNRYQESFCLGNLGCFHVYLGEYERAVAVLEQAAALGRRMGIPLAEASAEANLGNALRFLGRYEDAQRLEQRAGEVARRLGDARLEADAQLYGALSALGAHGSGGLTRVGQRPAGEGSNAGDSGGGALADGEGVQAETMARAALELARQTEMPGTEAAASMALALALDAGGAPLDDALEASRHAVAILDELGSVEGFEADIRLVHARLCLAAGHDAEAHRVLERAAAELEQMAAQISAPERRRRFLREIASNAAIVRLSSEHAATACRTA